MKEDMDTILEDEKRLAYARYLEQNFISKDWKNLELPTGLRHIRHQAFIAGWEAGLDLAAAAISSQRGMRMLAALAIKSH